MEIRPAEPAERAIAAEHAAVAFRELRHWLSLQAYRVLEKEVRSATQLAEGGELLLAVEGREVIGSVVYFPPGSAGHGLYPPDWAFIRALAVTPGRRRQGLGRALLEACLERAGQDGARALGVQISEAMVGARGLFGALGFQRVREVLSRDGLPNSIFRLDLG
ncbi:MAG: GNAT family N-acetyltransferase [Kiloniellales bacterium]|nr:GNAT family N-acetyltransferase [Kiloniellales bacterium]